MLASLDNVSLVPSAFMQCGTWSNTSQMSAWLPRCSLSVFPRLLTYALLSCGHHHSLNDCLLWRNAQSFEMCSHKPSLKHVILVSDGEGEAEEGEGKWMGISFCGSVVLGCSPWHESHIITFIINISTNGVNRLQCHNLRGELAEFVILCSLIINVWSALTHSYFLLDCLSLTEEEAKPKFK